MYTVKVTLAKLRELAMLAEWQLRELGFDPQSINVAWRQMEDDKAAQQEAKWRRDLEAMQG